MGLINYGDNLPCQYSPNRISEDRSLRLSPAMCTNVPGSLKNCPGIIVSRKTIENHKDNLKIIAFAVQIKSRFPSNGTIYDYNPHKVARMFNMTYNTVKKYVSYLIEYGMAWMHHGNLTIRKLRASKNRRYTVKVSGNIKEVVNQFREYLLLHNLIQQKKKIVYKEGIIAKSSAPTVKLIKKRRRILDKEGIDIFKQSIDKRIRLTVSSIEKLLRVNSRDAVAFRRHMISLGYGFCYETKLISDTSVGFQYADLPGTSYASRGRVYTRDSWVDF